MLKQEPLGYKGQGAAGREFPHEVSFLHLEELASRRKS